MIPGSFRGTDCRTSSTTAWAARPTAIIDMPPKRNGRRPPNRRPTTTYGLAIEKSTATPLEERTIRGFRRRNISDPPIIGRKQNERAETGGADCVALRHSLGRVPDCVEGVRRVAHSTSEGSSDISAMPPALSVTGPNASSATIMPARASMVVVAIAITDRGLPDYRSAMMPAMIVRAGSAVDSSETARPWITFVP